MNLQQLIERYVSYRQSLGEKFQTNGYILRAFGRTIGAEADVADVRPEQVSAFLTGPGPLTRTWHGKYHALLGFYRYAISRGHVTAAPLPTVAPKRPLPFVPHIYSNEELRRLLRATDSYQRGPGHVEPVTMRTLVLLLYGTGLRLSEALALDRPDVDLENHLLTVRQTKFYKSRLVPFSRQLGHALAQYVSDRPVPARPADMPAPFFTTRTGERLKQATVQNLFRCLRAHAGIGRTGSARYQPRLHDLRHTFAVHRLTSWYRQGADVQRLLPLLSVYLGHVHLGATQIYLSMTPELLAEANARFACYAGKEEHHD